MPSTSTLEDLLVRVRCRDKKALTELYERCAPGLLGMLLQTLDDRSAAEDVMTEVFSSLWKGAGGADAINGSAAAQLIIVARATAIRRLRAERGSTKITLRESEHAWKFPPWLPQPEEIDSLSRRRDVITRVLKQLPERQRQTLDLAVFKGYTEPEIAEKLGEPLGRVKSELRAGMRFLRHRLRAVLGIWSATI